MPRTLMLAAVLLFLAGRPAAAGEYNDVLSIGDAAPAWMKLPGTDGREHSLSDLADKPVVVVVFTCASCPTAVDYEERINALAKAQGGEKGQVAVVAISVNKVKEDLLPALTARAKEKGFAFTYVTDESQKIARDFGAVFTPEFYVLNRERRVVYMGAMDDATDASQVKRRYVEEAIAAALGGTKPEVSEVIARGCRVRYARERRSSSSGR
ncbi:AhpC/TSA family protein [Caulifigura coniformis]|uniref:AhpC/TSA family protein n=1 Tax=Caulifigura coniformis TaxID=2527983 RepID=A0A517SM64_9PLAN|nr:thioredoxin family protein [Caulifigura coniformis]QDT57201.1 AhpC/TSA family protein [Caulifigura coniformis]